MRFAFIAPKRFRSAVDALSFLIYKTNLPPRINEGAVNRIKISPLASTPVESKTSPSNTLIPDPFQLPGVLPDNEISVCVPLHYESNYAYPLIVWLHSDGDDCVQLQRIMPDVSLRNYVGIAPQSTSGNRSKGYYWAQDRQSVDSAHDSVMAAIDHASYKFNIDSSRIFLAGYGTGGTMAFRVAFQRPELFGGVVSLNGSLPQGRNPLSRLAACRNLPVFWAHCRGSAGFDQEDLCEQLKLLHVGGFSVTVRQYPCGDRLLPNILGDANYWIMEQFESTVG